MPWHRRTLVGVGRTRGGGGACCSVSRDQVYRLWRYNQRGWTRNMNTRYRVPKSKRRT